MESNKQIALDIDLALGVDAGVDDDNDDDVEMGYGIQQVQVQPLQSWLMEYNVHKIKKKNPSFHFTCSVTVTYIVHVPT